MRQVALRGACFRHGPRHGAAPAVWSTIHNQTRVRGHVGVAVRREAFGKRASRRDSAGGTAASTHDNDGGSSSKGNSGWSATGTIRQCHDSGNSECAQHKKDGLGGISSGHRGPPRGGTRHATFDHIKVVAAFRGDDKGNLWSVLVSRLHLGGVVGARCLDVSSKMLRFESL
jgi:hypothetical protein